MTRVCEFECIIRNNKYVNVSQAGNFHEWGRAVIEDLTATDNVLKEVSIGIVELNDGTVVQVPAESIRFDE